MREGARDVPRPPWRLNPGLGWLLLWIALVVVLQLAFAGSQPRRGALPMKAVLRTQDARGAGYQLSWLVPCDQRIPPSAMSRVETARAKYRHSRAVYNSAGVLV